MIFLIKILFIYKMLIPVRCYTCGKVVGNKFDHYKDLLTSGKTQPEAFKILNLSRYCCKRILLTHVEVLDTLIKYGDSSKSYKESLYNKDIPLFK